MPAPIAWRTGVFFGLRVRDVDCACKLFRREALRGHPGRVGRGVLLGRAAHQAAGGRPDGRRGRRAALPADGRLADRRQADGHLPRRPGLLAPAPAHLGEPRAGPAARRADRRRPEPEASSPRSASARVGVERVDEVPEDVEARVDHGSRRSISRHRRPSSPSSPSPPSAPRPAWSRTVVGREDRAPRPGPPARARRTAGRRSRSSGRPRSRRGGRGTSPRRGPR